MVTQLHLALVMAIDARLLVLDEPTLGLDLLYRKAFYDSLLNDYFEADRTILVTTHQVEEIQHILTDVVFIDRGRIVLDAAMEDLDGRFTELSVSHDKAASAQSLKPIHERRMFDRSYFIFDGVERGRLAELGEMRTPGLADLFVAMMTPIGAPAEQDTGRAA
jgi:ABC-2 type transport system ATP-binding protein